MVSKNLKDEIAVVYEMIASDCPDNLDSAIDLTVTCFETYSTNEEAKAELKTVDYFAVVGEVLGSYY